MKPPRRLAALLLGACLLAFSGCAHMMTDPGYPTGTHDSHMRGHLERMNRENSEYQNVLREVAK